MSENNTAPKAVAETGEKRNSRTQRVITGTILVICLAGILLVGGWLFAAIAFLAISLTIYEESVALRQAGHHPIMWTSYVALAIATPLMFFYSSYAIIPVLTIMSFCVLLCVMRRQSPELTDIMVSVLPMLTLVLPGMCLIALLDTEPRRLQMLLLVLVFTIAVGGDTFAYFVGSAIRGPKLCPNISPNKTIAGAIGGLAGSILCAIMTGVVAGWCFPDYMHFPPLWANALLGLVGGIAGQMGDLLASMVKRHCKIKDFGHLFPGHGGMLDRMDSIVFTAIIVYSYRVILISTHI